MKRLLFVLFVLGAIGLQAQLTLYQGDSIVLRFDSLPEVIYPSESFGSVGAGGVSFKMSGFDVAKDALQVELFENFLRDGAAANVVAEQANDGTLMPPGGWADFQGMVRFTMLTGSITFEEITFFHVVPVDSTSGERHQLVIIPMPGTNLIHALVPCAGPAAGGTWKNHGQFVSTMAKLSRQLVADRLLTREQRAEVVSHAAQSICGKKSKSPKD
jgi:hypothetical protein